MSEQVIEPGDVKMRIVREGDSSLEVEVTTRHGVAQLTMDLSSTSAIGLKAVLPMGNAYESKIDSWAGDSIDDESEEGRESVLRLAAAFVVRCFEKELRERS